MATGIPYKTAQLEDEWDAIVVGSGMGGLTTAVMLAKHAGKRVLVLERHYTAGGFTHTFHRPGFEWDVGLHYIGQMRQGEAVRKAFDHVTGGAVEWQMMPDVYDRVCVEDGKGPDGGARRFDYAAGPIRMRRQLVEWFPGEAKAIDKYLEWVKGANQLSVYFFAEKVLARAWKPLVGGSLRRSYLKFAKRTTAETLRKLKASPELAGVLRARWGGYGIPAGESSFGIHATIFGHYLRGAAYPVGGAGVQRSVKFVRYLPELGWEPVVLTGPGSADDRWTPSDESLGGEVPDSTTVLRVPGTAPGRCGMPSRAPSPPCRRNCAARSPGIRVPRWHGTPVSRSMPACRSTSAIRKARGSVAPTRTPTACCASIFPKAPTSAGTPHTNSTRLPQPSTAGPARHLDGKPLPRHSMNYYPWFSKQMLRRFLEPKLGGFNRSAQHIG